MNFNLNDVINLYVRNWEVDKRTQGIFYRYLFIMAAYLTIPNRPFDSINQLNAVFDNIANQMCSYLVLEPSEDNSLKKVKLDTYWFNGDIPESLSPMYMRMLYFTEDELQNGDYWIETLELCFIGRFKLSCTSDLSDELFNTLNGKSAEDAQHSGQNSEIINLLSICKAKGHFKNCTDEEKEDRSKSYNDILTEAKEKWNQRNKSCSPIETCQLEQALKIGLQTALSITNTYFVPKR